MEVILARMNWMCEKKLVLKQSLCLVALTAVKLLRKFQLIEIMLT